MIIGVVMGIVITLVITDITMFRVRRWHVLIALPFLILYLGRGSVAALDAIVAACLVSILFCLFASASFKEYRTVYILWALALFGIAIFAGIEGGWIKTIRLHQAYSKVFG